MQPNQFALATLCVAVLAASQVRAQGALEIPQPNSDQSGISIVSGWHCSASVIEVSFDGGPRIKTAYGTTRADTKGPCADEDNGFSLLWAYSLIGAGQHEVIAYADGVEFGRARFNVTDISDKNFLTGKSAEVRVGAFPDLAHDVILKWQESNQNFVMSDYLRSRDTYNVAGMWEMYGSPSVDLIFSIYVGDATDDPEVASLAGIMSDFEFETYVYAGAMRGNSALLLTDPGAGADYTGEFTLHFSGERTGTAELTKCSPSYFCPAPVGTILKLTKIWPEAEEVAAPSTAATLKEQSTAENRDQFDIPFMQARAYERLIESQESVQPVDAPK